MFYIYIYGETIGSRINLPSFTWQACTAGRRLHTLVPPTFPECFYITLDFAPFFVCHILPLKLTSLALEIAENQLTRSFLHARCTLVVRSLWFQLLNCKLFAYLRYLGGFSVG